MADFRRASMPGAVLAHSFTDLLTRLVDVEGKSIFWTEDEFVSLGDAYD
jgi:hypothetical protein